MRALGRRRCWGSQALGRPGSSWDLPCHFVRVKRLVPAARSVQLESPPAEESRHQRLSAPRDFSTRRLQPVVVCFLPPTDSSQLLQHVLQLAVPRPGGARSAFPFLSSPLSHPIPPTRKRNGSRGSFRQALGARGGAGGVRQSSDGLDLPRRTSFSPCQRRPPAIPG